MLITNSETQPATLGRRASACWVEGAYQMVAPTPIPVVGPTGLSRFVQGSGLPVAPAAKAFAGHTAAIPTPVRTTVRMTDQTLAVATRDGALGNRIRRRPPV